MKGFPARGARTDIITRVMDIYYEKRSPLLMRDCDMFRRIRPSAVLAMFQDCSEALTEGWGVGLDVMLEKGIIWVAAKAECTVTGRLPEHGETVAVRGWAGRSRGGIYPFHYVMTDAAGREIVTGCSLWVLSDLRTHSMLGSAVPRLDLPTPEPEGAPLPRMRPVKPPASCGHTPRRVAYSETDINGHLTNTRYMDWVCDLADAGFHKAHPMTGLRINYRAEIFPEQEVILDWDLTEERLWCAAAGRFEAALFF